MKIQSIIIICALSLTSCATILTGTKSKIKIDAPSGLAIQKNGSTIATTNEGSTSIKINGKALSTSKVVVGKTPLNIQRKPKVGFIVLNIFTTGGIGLLVDLLGGGGYKPVQDNFTVTE